LLDCQFSFNCPNPSLADPSLSDPPSLISVPGVDVDNVKMWTVAILCLLLAPSSLQEKGPGEGDGGDVTETSTLAVLSTTLFDDSPTGPSLGEILGVVTVICTIIYIVGITYKLLKIFRGEYEPTEPVYLKYK